MADQPPSTNQGMPGVQPGNAKFDESIGLKLVVDFNQWIAGLQKSEEAINSFGDVVSEIAKTIPQEFEHAQRKFEGVINGIIGGVNKVRNTFLKWEAGLAATTLAMAHHSARLERSMYMMERLAERTGKSVSGVYKVIENNMGGVARKADLVRGSIHMMNTEFNPAQMDKFVKIVKDASAAMGTDFSHSMEFAVKSVQTLNTHLLTNIGLVIRQEEVMAKAAQQNVGVSAEQLTPQMKQNAMLTLIQERSRKFEGSHEQLVGRGTYQWSDMKQNLADISEELGRVFIPAWAKAAQMLTHFTGILKSIVQNQWFQSIGKFISSILIPAITIGAVAFTALSVVLVALKPIIIAIPFLGLAVGIHKVVAALRGPAGLTGALKETGVVLDKVWTGSWRLMWDGSKQMLGTVKSFRQEFRNMKEWGAQAQGRSTFASLLGTTPTEMGLIDRGRKKLGEDWKKTVDDFRKQRTSLSKEFGTSPIQAMMLGGTQQGLGSKAVWTKFQDEAEASARAASGGRLMKESQEAINAARVSGQKAGEAFVIAQSSAGKKWKDSYGLQEKIRAGEGVRQAIGKGGAALIPGELDPGKLARMPSPDFSKVLKVDGFRKQAKALGDEIRSGMKYIFQGFMFEDGARALNMSLKKGLVGNITAATGAITSALTNTQSKLRETAKNFNGIFKAMFDVGIGGAVLSGLKHITMFTAKIGGLFVAFEVLGALYQRMKDWQMEKKFGSKEIEEESKQVEEKYDQLHKDIRKRKEQDELTKGTTFVSTEGIKSELARTKGRMTVEQIRDMAAPGMSARDIEEAKSKRWHSQLANTGVGLVQGAMSFVGADEAAEAYKTKIKRNEREIARLGVNWEAYEGATELKKLAERQEAIKNLNTSSMMLSDTTKILNKNFREYLQAESGAAPIMSAVTNMIRERLAAYSDLILRAKEYDKWREKLNKEPAAVQEAVTKKYIAQRLMQPGAKETPEEVRFAGTAADIFSNKPGEYQYRAIGSTKWREANATGIAGGAPGFARRREGVADTPAMRYMSMIEEKQKEVWEALTETQREQLTAEIKRIKDFAPQAEYSNTQNSVEFQKSISEARASITAKIMKDFQLDIAKMPSIESFKKDDQVWLKAQSLAEMSIGRDEATAEGQQLIKEQGGEKRAREARLQGYLEKEAAKKRDEWVSERTPEVQDKIKAARKEIEVEVGKVEQMLYNSLKSATVEAGRDAVIAFEDAFYKKLSEKKNLPVVTANMVDQLKTVMNKIETAQGLQNADLTAFGEQIGGILNTWTKAYDTHTNMLKKHMQALLGIYATERRIADGITKAPASGMTSIADIEHSQKMFSLDAMDKELLHASLLWEDMTAKAAAFTQIVATIGQKGINTPSLEMLKKQYDGIQTDFEQLTTQFNSLFDKALDAQKNLIASYTSLKKEQAGYNDGLRESNSRIIDANRQIKALKQELSLLPTPGATGKVDVAQMKLQVANQLQQPGAAAEAEKELFQSQFDETQKQKETLYGQVARGGSELSPQDTIATITKALDAVHKEFELVLKMTQAGDRDTRITGKAALERGTNYGNRGYEESKIKELNRRLEEQNEKVLKGRIRAAEIDKEAAQLEWQLFQDQYELRKAQLELEVEKQKREIDIILMWRNASEQQLANMMIMMKLQAALSPNEGLEKVMKEAEEKQKTRMAENETFAASAEASRKAAEALLDKIRVLMDNVNRSEAEVKDARLRSSNVAAGKDERDNLPTGMGVFPERRDPNAKPQVIEYSVDGKPRTFDSAQSQTGGAFNMISRSMEGAASDKDQRALQEKMKTKGSIEAAQREISVQGWYDIKNAKTPEERLVATTKALPPEFQHLAGQIAPMDGKGGIKDPNIAMATIFDETVNKLPPMMQTAIESAFGDLKKGLDMWMTIDKKLLEDKLGVKILEPTKSTLSSEAVKGMLTAPEEKQKEFIDKIGASFDALSAEFQKIGSETVSSIKEIKDKAPVGDDRNLVAQWFKDRYPMDKYGDVGRTP